MTCVAGKVPISLSNVKHYRSIHQSSHQRLPRCRRQPVSHLMTASTGTADYLAGIEHCFQARNSSLPSRIGPNCYTYSGYLHGAVAASHLMGLLPWTLLLKYLFGRFDSILHHFTGSCFDNVLLGGQ